MSYSIVKTIAIISALAGSVTGTVETFFAQPASANHLHSKMIAKAAKKNIVQTAQATPSLSSLVSAVVAAGLADTLSGKGPFTVFAPDNAAFAKIKAPADKATLAAVLTYHVVPGNLTSGKLHDGQVLTTVNGKKLTVIKRNGMVKLKTEAGKISVVKLANVKTSNGVVHVINRVLIP